MRAGISSSGAFISGAADFASWIVAFAAFRAAVAGQRLDASHAGRDARVGDAGDQSDVAGAPHMGAAAQLDRPAERVAAGFPHRHDAHLVVFTGSTARGWSVRRSSCSA